jgi:predicted nucleic acid-binding protein
MEIDANRNVRQKTLIQSWKQWACDNIEESVAVRQEAVAFRRKGINPQDALHLACAVIASADYFITTDLGILKKNIREIKTLNPKEFVHLY